MFLSLLSSKRKKGRRFDLSVLLSSTRSVELNLYREAAETFLIVKRPTTDKELARKQPSRNRRMTLTSCEALRLQISATEAQLERLKAELHAKETEEGKATTESSSDSNGNGTAGDGNVDSTASADGHSSWPLRSEEYRRYGRQMILDKVGLEGQIYMNSCFPSLAAIF